MYTVHQYRGTQESQQWLIANYSDTLLNILNQTSLHWNHNKWHHHKHISFIYSANMLHEVRAWLPHRKARQQVPLLDAFWQREPDLGVMELLDQRASTAGSRHLLHLDDLDRVCPGPVTSPHVAVALSHSPWHTQVTVLAVHVVSTRSWVITQPDAEVLDFDRGLLWNLQTTIKIGVMCSPKAILLTWHVTNLFILSKTQDALQICCVPTLPVSAMALRHTDDCSADTRTCNTPVSTYY